MMGNSASTLSDVAALGRAFCNNTYTHIRTHTLIHSHDNSICFNER